MSCNLYFSTIKEMITNIEKNQKGNITKAAEIIADSIMKGGVSVRLK